MTDVPDQARALTSAVDRLRRGGLVATPTDTQYALSALAGDDAAVRRVFALKQRPLDEPQPIFLPSLEALDEVAAEVGAELRGLAAAVWPGALTLVLRKRPGWHSLAVRGDTVALRIPDHPVALALLAALGQPITGSSANVHGQPPALTAAEASEAFGAEVLVLEGGALPKGTASTILDCAGPRPRVLRAGAVSRTEVEALVAAHLGTTVAD